MTGWFGRRSLRSRLMVVGLAGVAGALLVGGIVLYAAMGAALDRATTAPATSTRREAGSSRMPPAASVVARGTGSRRTRARSLASRTTKENGLVR